MGPTRIRRGSSITPSPFAIELAEPGDLAALPRIEREAASRFVGWTFPLGVLEEETPIEEFLAAQRAGRLWVARLDSGEVVGFAQVEWVGGQPHLEELDVHPAYGRQGIGTALVQTVQRWARASGFSTITLTAFRDVPWNAPFYARVGFRTLPPHALSAELQAVVAEEAGRGLGPATRVVMSCCVDAA